MLDNKIQASENAVVITGSNSGNIYTGPTVNNFVYPNGHAVEVQLHRPFRDLNRTENNDLALLTWQSRLPLQLVGRSIEMQSLLAWANKDINLSIAVIQGSAGVGKTRLAFELADALYLKGWSAGKLSNPEETIALPESKLGCLLILDYPEEHVSALNQFIEKLSNLPTPPFKLRILLLCRSLDSIASYKLQTLCDQNLYPLRLQALAMQEPFQLLQEVLPSFAKIKNEAPPTISEADFRKWLQLNPNHSSPLLVLVFAISVFYQKNNTQTIAEVLIQNLLLREQQHLITQCKNNNISESKVHGVWLLWQLAAFNGSLTEEELRQLLPQIQLPAYDGVELPNLQELKKLSVWHKGQGLTSIQPDLFAAHALANRSDLEPILTACIKPLFELGLDKPNSPIAKRLANLIRLHLDWPSTSQYPAKIMVETLANSLKNETTNNLTQAITPYIRQDYLPYPLIPLAVVIEQKWIKHFEILAEKNFTAYGADLALSLNNLSISLRYTGEHQKALTSIQRAVNIFQNLSLKNIATYSASFAQSLNTQSNILSDIGEHQHALTSSQLAVDILEILSLENFAVYGADLALSLNNLSNHLRVAGEHQQALTTSQRAVEQFEKLILENFAIYAPNLASSLNNLSIHFNDAGEHQKALTTIQRAVEICEILSIENFAVYGADFGNRLDTLSGILRYVGENHQALTTNQRAVAVYEKLARGNFAAYGDDLARNLFNFSILLRYVGEHQKALTTIQRAINILENLAEKNYAVYGEKLEICRANLSELLENTQLN